MSVFGVIPRLNSYVLNVTKEAKLLVLLTFSHTWLRFFSHLNDPTDFLIGQILALLQDSFLALAKHIVGSEKIPV